MLDADVILTNIETLKVLIAKDFTVVSPMLMSDGVYSNFWCGMTENYYYKRTDDYKPILNRKKTGCFDVPMVHSAVLISMRYDVSDKLTYYPSKITNYDGPEDDIIAFALNSKALGEHVIFQCNRYLCSQIKNRSLIKICLSTGIPLYICNEAIYGFVPVPLEDNDPLEKDYEQMLNIKLEAISQGTPLPLNHMLEEYVTHPNKWKFGCDEIYMINLERRQERRFLMELSFKELGMSVQHFSAIDGRNLDMNDLREYSITLMPNYEDPYHKRPMKAGEVGCFLSHYYIWQDIVKNHHRVALLLEDDIHFVPYFRHRFIQLMDEITQSLSALLYIIYNMFYFRYIGRKILLDGEEEYATPHTTRPLYSYWTLGYLISERGAKKLLRADPLSKMLPVDEFLPIMFDQHPK
ncbi:chromosome associated protein D3 [Bombyx mori]|uniref:Uncharacterized protein Bm6922 n=1 Tax=Bombyx mori TaxID=7091 RepID=Q8T106_BOMMO|nr:chromosome associated protein D3 [Bombyx mori]BAB85193.1 hypothetical protein [Bombyx mori]BAC10614.1 hypothetical protein [Bombyx mori]